MAISTSPPDRLVVRNAAWHATQNIVALVCVTGLASRGVIPGNTAACMILAILGVIALPTMRGKPPGSVGIFALAGAGAVRFALAVSAGVGHIIG